MGYLLVDVTLGMLKSLTLQGCAKPGLSNFPRYQKKSSVKLVKLNTDKLEGQYQVYSCLKKYTTHILL